MSDELTDGYLDGFNDERDAYPDSLANRGDRYRHGWMNGRDDRLGRPRASAAAIRNDLSALPQPPEDAQ